MLFIGRRIVPAFVFGVYTLLVAILYLTIFYWRVFPTCLVPGEGLTRFKVFSEYIICVLLLTSLVLLVLRRAEFDKVVFRLLAASIVTTIFAELAFTAYVVVTGWPNALGHYLKIVSFALVYLAFVEVASGSLRQFSFATCRKPRKPNKPPTEPRAIFSQT